MKDKTYRYSARLAAAALLAAAGVMVLAPALWAAGGYLVSDEQRECIAVAGPPGIGIGGYRYSETCPEGYAIKELPSPPEPPAWQKLLDAIDSWFGLKNRILWIPTAKQLLLLSFLVLLIRRALPFVSGGKTLVVSTVLAWLLYIQGAVADGSLSAYEAIASLLATVAGAAGLWEGIKRLVRRRLRPEP